MARKKKPLPIFERVTITDIAAEGKSLVRLTIPAHDGTPESQLVVFVPWCVPGDVVDLQIKRKKHSYAEAEAIRFHELSKVREVPRCQHFGVCGGCKWQNLPYEEQLRFKEKQVFDQLTRIGHLALPHPGTTSADGLCTFQPIMGSARQYEYRNKLDFGAANLPTRGEVGGDCQRRPHPRIPHHGCVRQDSAHREMPPDGQAS